MSSVVIAGNTSGSVTLAAPNVAGTTTLTLPATSATIATDVNGTLYPLTSGTSVASTSGTSITFTGIPSWVKRITVMLSGVSTNGTSVPQIQLGTSGGVETSGYVTSIGNIQNSTASSNFPTTGFPTIVSGNYTAATPISGTLILSLLGSNTFVCMGTVGREDTGTTVGFISGKKTLSGTLDRVRITTVNGTDTFDAGSINILYE